MPENMPRHPPEQLFIYYLQGRLAPEHESFDHTFIGNWQEAGDTFLFFSQPADSQVQKMLENCPGLTLLDSYQMDYDQWHGCQTTARRIGRFMIIPPWETARHTAAPYRIRLDPGVVFGTGTHQTTHDCLEALELVFKRHKIQSTIDLGTGTGVLSLAAARLGCPKILAVDINFLAAKTAGRNVRLNHLEHRILTVQGDAQNFMDISSDLMIANIHYDVMQRLLSSRGFLARKWFILSGLLRSQAAAITKKLTRQRAELVRQWSHDGIWYTFLGQHRTEM